MHNASNYNGLSSQVTPGSLTSPPREDSCHGRRIAVHGTCLPRHLYLPVLPDLPASLTAHRSRASLRSAMYLHPCRQKNARALHRHPDLVGRVESNLQPID
jgi:hypothetical protein